MNPVDLEEFTKRLYSETDRASAILGASLLDAKLEDVFRRRLQCLQDELLKGDRPLATFSARISSARALAWINEDAYSDLNTIRKIRNFFAHSYDHSLSFKDIEISDRCVGLRVPRAFIEGFDDAPRTTLSSAAFRRYR